MLIFRNAYSPYSRQHPRSFMVRHRAGLPTCAAERARARSWWYGGVCSPPRVKGAAVRERGGGRGGAGRRWGRKRSRERPGALYYAGTRQWRWGQGAWAATRYSHHRPEVDDGLDGVATCASERGRRERRRAQVWAGARQRAGPSREREGEEKKRRGDGLLLLLWAERSADFSFLFPFSFS